MRRNGPGPLAASVVRANRSGGPARLCMRAPRGGVVMNKLLRNKLWLLIAGMALLGATAMVVANSQKAVPVEIGGVLGQAGAPVVQATGEADDTDASSGGRDAAVSADAGQAVAAPAADAGGPAQQQGAGEEPSRGATILVHVAGAVNAPGVYELPADARVAHAVEAAGGAAKGADLDSVNLALPLRDGQQVFIPEVSAASAGAPAALLPQHAAAAVVVPGRIDASVSLPQPASEEAAPPAGSGAGAGVAQLKVNVNTAGLDELCELPGIGPALASRIIEYRTKNGPFARVEDLILVSGIGEAKLAKLLPVAVVK